MPHPLTCPQCRSPFRSARALPARQMIRCPQCGGHFVTTAPLRSRPLSPPPLPPLSAPELPVPRVALAPLPRAYRALALAAALTLLLSGAALATLHALGRNRQPPAAPPHPDGPVARVAETGPPAAHTRPAPEPTGEGNRRRFDRLMGRADALLADGHCREAAKAYAEALRLCPGSSEAARGLAAAHAAKEAREERKKREADRGVLLARARAAAADGRYQEAIRDLRAADRLCPDDAEVRAALRDATDTLAEARAEYDRLMARSRAAAREQEYEEALRLCRQAARLLPGDAEAARALRAAEQAVEDLNTVEGLYRRWMYRGRKAMQDGNPAAAIHAYTEALKFAPRDAAATEGLRGARTAAEGRRRNRTRFDWLMQKGTDALEKRQYRAAEESFVAALRAEPGEPRASAALHHVRYFRAMAGGKAALDAGRRQEAARFFRAALTEIPGDAAATRYLADALKRK